MISFLQWKKIMGKSSLLLYFAQSCLQYFWFSLISFLKWLLVSQTNSRKTSCVLIAWWTFPIARAAQLRIFVISAQRGFILISLLMIRWDKRSKPDVLAVSRSMESCLWFVINKKVSSVAGKLLVLLKDNVSIVCNSPQVLSAIVKELYLASLSTI